MGRARGSPVTIHMQSGAQYMVINLHSEIVQLLKKKELQCVSDYSRVYHFKVTSITISYNSMAGSPKFHNPNEMRYGRGRHQDVVMWWEWSPHDGFPALVRKASGLTAPLPAMGGHNK